MIPNRFWAQAKGPLSTLYPYRSFIHLDTTVLSDVAHAWGSLCDLAGVGRSKAKQICQGWQDEPTWSTWIANHPHHIMQYFGVIPLSNSEKWRIHRDPGIQNNSKHGRCHHYWEGSPSKLCVSKPNAKVPWLVFWILISLWVWHPLTLIWHASLQYNMDKHHVQTMECKKTGPPTPRIFQRHATIWQSSTIRILQVISS